jgi:transposase-like protein
LNACLKSAQYLKSAISSNEERPCTNKPNIDRRQLFNAGWPGYNDLETSGFHHQILRQEATVGEDLLPNCHRVASLLKRWLLGTHQGAVCSENLQYYLDEFTFRFNPSKSF